MVTKIEVSRFFEPVPQMTLEARYTFTWINGELDEVKLSQRRDRGEDNHNSQFEKVEDLTIEDIPDSVIREAQKQLESYSQELSEANA